MKYVDEYRDPSEARRLIEAIRRQASAPVRFMEVCGTHTTAIFRHGLRQVLPQSVELVSGPGCPVCVTAARDVDQAVKLASEEGVVVATFGDMMRVPGARRSLSQVKAEGGRATVVYSTFEALDLARSHPEDEVVFLGVGFETTAPTVAAALVAADEEGLKNFSVLSAHKLLPPALEALLSAGELELSGFLMPGHVTTIIGARAYEALARRHGLACVVCGFEPLDILQSILMLLRQTALGRGEVEIQYTRGASWEGNRPALSLMDRVFEPCDSLWRGLGLIPKSGLKLKDAWAHLDAAARFDLNVPEHEDPPGCRCGEVLRGLVRPPQCPLFAKACQPAHPVGPCMVSSEGTCAAYYKYHRD